MVLFPYKRSTITLLISVSGFIFCLYLLGEIGIAMPLFQPREIIIGDGNIDTSNYQLDEEELIEDFPVDPDTFGVKSRIPKIIHQTWKDEYVPKKFRNNIKSFVDKHPDYRYYFWTDKSARKLIAERHPYLLETFDNYVERIRTADLIRYVVLYEFGGVYADLDTECVRNLDRVLSKYSCVLTPEPYEQSTLLYNTPQLVTNSIMFSEPFHPFLKLLMTSLSDFNHFATAVDSTGPMFLTYLLRQYQKETQDLPVTHAHSVFIPSSHFFQNEIDPKVYNSFRKLCKRFKTLNDIQKKGCVSLLRRGMVNRKRSRYIYTKHSFSHDGTYTGSSADDIEITTLVKHACLY